MDANEDGIACETRGTYRENPNTVGRDSVEPWPGLLSVFFPSRKQDISASLKFAGGFQLAAGIYLKTMISGLQKSAESGNSVAIDALIGLSSSTNINARSAAVAGLKGAAANQNANAAEALRSIGVK